MGGRGRSRTQRKHFAQSRENNWKYTKNDPEQQQNGTADNNNNRENNESCNSFMTRNNKRYQLCKVQMMFNLTNINLALAKVISQIYRDDTLTQPYYYEEEYATFEWKIVNLEQVYQYAVAVESMLFKSRIYINW